jgi:hypothetical protein
MEANQNSTNINEKKNILPIENLIICEIVFCGLVTRSVNIIIEMPIASITERLLIEVNVT